METCRNFSGDAPLLERLSCGGAEATVKSMSTVRLKHVKKIYDHAVTAVHDFSLDIADKEFIVLAVSYTHLTLPTKLEV